MLGSEVRQCSRYATTRRRIWKRDAPGHWLEITPRSPLGAPAALTVDHAGNLYVAEQSFNDCCPPATLGSVGSIAVSRRTPFEVAVLAAAASGPCKASARSVGSASTKSSPFSMRVASLTS